jgi:DUF177 domain-containing protein
MLLLNLARISTPHERFDKVYDKAVFGADRDAFIVVEPVTLGFDLYKDKDLFRLVGRVQSMLEMPCSRCLEPFRVPVDAPVDLRYRPRPTHGAEGEREVQEDDFSTAFYDNDAIDLGQLMSEQFYLALPMKPLCTEGCRGLCSQCGTNLNRERCSCVSEWEDPRFAALKALQDQSRRQH